MMSVCVLLVAVVAGGIVAISGFGIGSLLTPLVAVSHGTKLAVAIVSVPHLIGTAARFVGLHKRLDTKVFLNFGILSAAGGLLGRCLMLVQKVRHCDCVRLFACIRRHFRPDRIC